jgi:hypothetical protein
MGIFCGSLYSVFLLNAVLGLGFLAPDLSRPQVTSKAKFSTAAEIHNHFSSRPGPAGAVTRPQRFPM